MMQNDITTSPPELSTTQPSETRPNSRGKPSSHGQFIWQPTEAIDRINKELGQTKGACGVAVYVALTRLSTENKNGATIKASVSKIAGMSQLGYRRTLETLHALRDKAKVITIESQRRPGALHQEESSYTLLRLTRGASADLPKGRQQTTHEGELRLPRSSKKEESIKKDSSIIEEKPAAAHGISASLPTANALPGGSEIPTFHPAIKNSL